MSKSKMKRLRDALLQAAEALQEALAELDIEPASDDPALDEEDWAPLSEATPELVDLGGEG